ncbi:hypothetical protein SAMN04490248_11920 [Salinihabitans flavidus]|uniref:Uncharacterized protein n=1 Tax=Salinihabitans flavidus TaxID=569882 RepID=A0A1H8UBT8_9RHOB|nr:hypothetical protein [Salinihabitans flavidus]SEP00333.1 hypothetical protein SAMN04490248_11920 [Salinihabitans flavidus]
MKSGIFLPELVRKTAEGILDRYDTLVANLPEAPGVACSGPSKLDPLNAPEGYSDLYDDVARSRDLSIIADPDLHFTLYGRQQGRALLARIPTDLKRVVIIAPSYRKQCGIGEYGRYLSTVLKRQVDEVHVVRTSSAAIELGTDILDGALVLVNHGPGLFDGLNPRLSQGESTTLLLQNLDRIARDFGGVPLMIHHSLLDTDQDLLFSRQQQIFSSDIPSTAFISSAGRHFFIPTLELGVSPVELLDDANGHRDTGDRDMRPEVVGFFGFFQYGGKDFDSLFHLVRELRGRLVGSVATSNADELARFEETLSALNLPHDLGSGWVKDTELLERLQDADYFYLPQNDYDHWNNSATARFVTNLERPLFLPPHHPFLDMADGSIFASKEDLPRIVAHFREEGHFQQAVNRVRAFRKRADMANTAKALRTEMVARTASIGRELLESPSACSAERFLELPESARPAFAEVLGAAPDATLEEVLPHLPALYRAPAPRQYWRKHYELGDLLHGTLLETIHDTYLACAKRPVRFAELIDALATTLDETDPNLWPFATTARAAILRALEEKGGLFHDPEIVFLENGALTEDWRALLDPGRIESFVTEKAKRRARIRDVAKTRPKRRPAVTNMAELLVIPAEMLQDRSAPIDLSELDLADVQSARRPAQRLNRLVAQANAVGLSLGEHLVFDHMQVPEIDPSGTEYALEDFIFFQGDMFLLNAVRRIDKRDPYALESLTLTSMLNTLGMEAVLRHLLIRAENRVEIVNFDEGRKLEAESDSFRRFMDAARDPLCGLIEARNAYEMQKRHNTRWWLANKAACDAIWQDCGANSGFLNLIYALLSESPAERANPSTRHHNPSWQMDRMGRFHRKVDAERDGISLEPGKSLKIAPTMAALFEQASLGFFPVEPAGVWTNGLSGSVQLSLEAPALEGQDTLQVQVGVFGSAHFDTPREMHISLMSSQTTALSLFERKPVEHTPSLDITRPVTRDEVITVDVPLRDLPGPGLYTLHLEIDQVTSPAAMGVSEDSRELGILLKSLCLCVTDDSDKENQSQDRVLQYEGK